MMSDDKKLNEEQLKNVAGGMECSTYDRDEEWIVHGSETRKSGSCWSGYEKDGEWVMGKS